MSATDRRDVLRLPGLGRLLRSRRARRAIQLGMFALAGLVVWQGLAGPRLAPRNLSTLLVWVHWRGLLVLSLLVVGNAFCYSCPLMLPREVFRRFIRPPLTWPAVLRGKWLAAGLLVATLFAYELFDLWASPWVTAWLVVAYFGAALFVDVLFRGASFCKWVCPIGQFNFVASTASPLEVRAKEATVCGACTTHDCIAGRPQQPVLRGCELGLYLPSKVGNLECTFCLDCVHACPHNNVAIAARLPAAELSDPSSRAGIGRPQQRLDYSALVLVFVFGALLNALGMVSPVYELQRWIADLLGLRSDAPVLGLMFLVGLVVMPALLLGLCAAASRRLGRLSEPLSRIAMRFAWGLVPLACGVWLAHYSFHLLTGFLTVIPVVQKTASDLFGRAVLGAPAWELGGLRPGFVKPIETGLLLLGLLVSLGVCWRVAEDVSPSRTRRVVLPWAGLVGALFLAALWLMSQPMEMRGTFLGG